MRCPNRFGWWWLCLVAGNLLSSIADRMTTDHSGLAQIQAATSLVVVSELILIAAAILFIGVLRLITSNLWHRAHLARSQIFGDPAGGDPAGGDPASETQRAETQRAKCSSESTATATNTSVR